MPPKEGRKRCCVISIVIVVILVAAGLCVYFFGPWDSVLNKMNLPGDSNNEGGGGNGSAPAPSPTKTPLFTYQFIQCADPSSNCCNGLEEICNLGVNDILWATSHNAMATKEGNFIFGYNHLYNLEESLNAGYRAINLDVCNCGGDYQFCHGICTVGARSPTEVLTNILLFLENNPSEIILINLELNSGAQGGSDVSLDTFASLLSQNVAGFDEMLYTYDETQPWPTLQTLIDAQQRLLLFHFNGPTSCANGACPDGFHYWFDYAAETEFEFTSQADFGDTATSCAITRGAGSTKDFFAVTSFVTPPNEDEAVNINAQAALQSRIQACSDYNGLDVNLLYVDFWSIGDMPEVVQTYNKALAARRTKQRRMLR